MTEQRTSDQCNDSAKSETQMKREQPTSNQCLYPWVHGVGCQCARADGRPVLLTEWGEAMGLLHDALERAEHDLMAVGHAPDGPARTEAMADLRKWQAKLIEFIGRMGADSTPDVATVSPSEGT